MRICLLSQEYPPETGGGGIGTQTFLKASGLAARGHEVHVVSASWDKLERSYSVGNVRIYRVAEPDLGKGGFEQSTYVLAFSFAAARKLHELSAALDFDIVQLPEYCGEGFVFQIDTFEQRKAKYVVQLHGPLAMFAQHLGWPRMGSTFQQVCCFMESMVVHRADQIIASSHNTAAFCARYYGLNLRAIRVIHSGIDTNRFAPGPNRSSDGEFRILFVGTLVGDKGIGLLLDALIRLKNLEPRVCLRAIGRGSDEDIRRLHRKAEANGVADRVEIVGYVPYDELPSHYRWCDVFGGPSTFEPGPGNVYLEAMSAGRPVLACRSGGTPEVVLDGRTGVLVPPRDIDALTDALAELAGNPLRRQELGRTGREWAKKQFSIESYLDRVENIYLDVLRR
jgi:glycosyltransferase involved in cell wall biosynthesis